MKGHLIIPLFIPNQGCLYRCIFCRQETITNRPEGLPTPDDIGNAIDVAIRSKYFRSQRATEVAFYGGTFTSLPTASMVRLLAPVKPYLEKSIVQSIRLSTRPDALSAEKLDILDSFGVSTVELGAQSMNDKVLVLSNRGHTSRDTINAVKLLKEGGFKVGIQLMPGLPGDSKEAFMETVDRVIGLRPDMARLYPTLVLRGTALARWYEQGKYTPMGLDDAVTICKEACVRLENAGIPVIRIGLMSSPPLLKEGEIIAGPWHPALGFLVRSAVHLEKLKPHLPTLREPRNILLLAPREEIPLIRGHKNAGIRQIEAITGAVVKDIMPDDSIPPGGVSVQGL